MAELYHDVKVQERLDIKPDGRAQKIYKISAYTRGGTLFTLDVQEADFNKAKVDQILKARAGEIDEITSL